MPRLSLLAGGLFLSQNQKRLGFQNGADLGVTFTHVRHTMSSVLSQQSTSNPLLGHVCGSMYCLSVSLVLSIATPPPSIGPESSGIGGQWGTPALPKLEDVTRVTFLTDSYPRGMYPDIEVSEKRGAWLHHE